MKGIGVKIEYKKHLNIRKIFSLFLAICIFGTTQGFVTFAQTVSKNKVADNEETKGNELEQGISGNNYAENSTNISCLSNPQIVDGISTWDCVCFGRYPQSDPTGEVTEPIKWRILKVEGNDAFLVADKILDIRKYSSGRFTWETCEMRKWLNNDFLNAAFTASEQKAIIETTIVNNSNPTYGTSGGKATKDKVFLLSLEDVTNSEYGFSADENIWDKARERVNTAYVAAGGSGNGKYMYGEGCADWWWLRTPGYLSYNAATIISEGGKIGHNKVEGDVFVLGSNGNDYTWGVCPALHLDLSQDAEYLYVGTVDSYGNTNSQFNLYKYRADYLNNLSNPSSAAWNQNIYDKRICEQLVNELEKTNFKTASEAWTVLQNTFKTIDNPGEVQDIALKEKDMYEAMILEVLSSTTEISLGDDEKQKIAKETKKIISLIKEGAQTNDTLDFINDLEAHNVKWSSLSSNQQQEVMKIIENYFKETDYDLTQANKFMKNVDTIMKVVDDLESCINYIVSYVTLYQMSEAQKAVIERLYEECPVSNTVMKEALCECLEIITSSNLDFVNQMITGSCTIVGRDLVTAWVGVYWEDVKAKIVATNPRLLAIMLSYKASTYISNVMFGTDETIEKYFNMVAMKEFRDVAGKAYESLKSDYENTNNEWQAEVYLAGADMLYQAMDADCEYGLKYAKVLDEAVLNQFSKLWLESDTENAIDAIETIQQSYKLSYYSMLTAWIYELELDYPEEYPNYEKLIKSTWETFEKSYEIACPVDVYIYDKDEQLVASVIDNQPAVYTDVITIMVQDDVKTVYFAEESDSYKIKYVGTDTGEMDIRITEYQDNQSVRTVLFNQVELTDGIEYFSEVPNGVLSEETCQLEKVLEETIKSNYDSSSDAQDNKHKITIVNGIGYQNEIPSMTIEACEGEKISISALVSDISRFEGWSSSEPSTVIKDSQAVCTDIYIGNSDCTITATLKGASVSHNDIDNGVNNENNNNQNDNTTKKQDESKSDNLTDIKIKKLSISAPSKKLAAGKKVKLTLKATPANATNKAVTWKTSNKKYATVNKNGKLTLKKAGAGKTVTITAKAKDGSGKKATIKIKIMKHAVKSIKIKAPSKTLKAGKSMKLETTIKTTGKKVNKTLKWSSSNTKYATVSKSGKVKAKKAGKGKTVTITAKATDGSNKKAKVKIKIK